MTGKIAITLLLTITSPQIVDKIVAVVENTPITLYEVKHYSKIYNSSLTETLNSLIDNILIEQEARRLNIEVTEDELNHTISRIIEDENLSKDEFIAEIKKLGFTDIKEYKRELKLQLLKKRIAIYLYRNQNPPSEEELKKYYLSHKEECVSNPEVEIYHIFLKGTNSSTKEKAYKIYFTLKKIKDPAEREKKFMELARTFSQSPSSAEGGRIGWIERGTLLPEIEKIAFSQPEGEISPPIAVKNGFHIIYTHARKEKHYLDFNGCREIIEKNYAQKNLEEWYKKWLKNLRQKKEVEVKGL